MKGTEVEYSKCGYMELARTERRDDSLGTGGCQVLRRKEQNQNLVRELYSRLFLRLVLLQSARLVVPELADGIQN